MRTSTFLTALLLLAGCGDDDGTVTPMTDAGRLMDAGMTDMDAGMTDMDAGGDTDAGPMLPEEDDTVHTALELNLDDATGVAHITVRDDGDGITWLHVPSAETTVERADGTAVTTMVDETDPQYIGVPMAESTETLTFRYSFNDALPATGWDSTLGFSIIWPNYCGAIFPCDNHPKDGTTFEANITYTGERTLVYPPSITAQGPPYMFAMAISDFERVALGTTAAGTDVVAWIPTGASDDIRNAVNDLTAQFGWYEETYGAYIFGDEVGSVFVPNNDVGIGGMEHHPYWHVVEGAWVPPVHAHEAAHGWYGNGVRIACWEDFVLSEGVVSYMEARAIGVSGGATAQEEHFDGMLGFLEGFSDGVAWINDSCDPDIQFDMHALWSPHPYYKGALFFRAVAERTSYEQVDAALASFYEANKETAQRMQALIDHMEAELEIDLTEEVNGWLLSPTLPGA